MIKELANIHLYILSQYNSRIMGYAI